MKDVQKTVHIYEIVILELKNIRDLVPRDQLKEAYERLIDIGQHLGQDSRNEIMDIEGANENLHRNYNNGLMTMEAYQVGLNRNRKTLLDFISYQIDQFHRKFEAETARSSEAIVGKEGYLKEQEAVGVKKPEIICEGTQITKTYPDNNTFRLGKINFRLRMGKITGLVGQNAAGKTTLLRIVAGILAQDKGQLRYPSLTHKNNSWYHIKRQIGYLPQDLTPWRGYLIDNLHIAATKVGLRGKKNQKEVRWIAKRLGLTEFLHLQWKEISGGYKTRFALAELLLQRPKLLVLDEPLAHLDIHAQNLFLDDLKSITRHGDYASSVIVSSQNIPEIERVCDEIIFIRDGKAVYNESLKNIGKQFGDRVYEFELIEPLNDEQLSGLRFIKKEALNKDQTLVQFTMSSWYKPEVVLNEFFTRKINFLAFRDITSSTKRLFENEQ